MTQRIGSVYLWIAFLVAFFAIFVEPMRVLDTTLASIAYAAFVALIAAVLWSVGAAPGVVEEILAYNRTLYNQNCDLGGTNYPISAVRLTRQDWERHYGPHQARRTGSEKGEAMENSELHPDVGIGRVRPRVTDLERAVASYCDVLGFAVAAYGPDFGLPGAAFLAAGRLPPHRAEVSQSSKEDQ